MHKCALCTWVWVQGCLFVHRSRCESVSCQLRVRSWPNGAMEAAESRAFGSGFTLLWLCDLGLVPASSGPKVPSSKMTVLCFMLQTPSLALQARQGWSHVIPQGPVGHGGES